jgi:tRNA pseudouridine38-40 synthase
MATRNIKLTLSYDGSKFHGWQVQPGLPTVQAALGEAIAQVTGDKIVPQGSGRTDAGVHALAQVASFSTTSSIPLENMRKALNSLLPAAIRALSVEEAPEDFHARRSAKRKTYEDRLYRGEILPPFLVNLVSHQPYPLDRDSMAEAAAAVEGEHDFTSFAAVDPEKGAPQQRTNVRTIFESKWQQRGEEWVYTVRGNGFLHHMVRNLVGTFLLVGKGSLRPADMARILAERSRSAAGPTAPAEGLYLVNVEY